VSGAFILLIGVISVFESIMRAFFSRPTSWSMDISLYLLIWAIFLGSAYSFQEKGHVAVDLIREMCGSKNTRRIMSLVSYAFCILFIIVLVFNGTNMIINAVRLKQLTLANIQIPIVYLYLAILIGSLLMLLTVIFIILDLINGGEKYL